MTKYSGKDFWVEIQIDGTWYQVPGQRSTSLKVNNEQVDSTVKDDVPWRQLAQCGLRSSDISISGVCRDDIGSATFRSLLSSAFNGDVLQARIISNKSETVLSGGYLVSSMERSGESTSAEMYNITFSSAATVRTPEPTPFIFTIDVTKTSSGGTVADHFKLPLASAGLYAFSVNWGDGTSDYIDTWNASTTEHTYSPSAPGYPLFTVSITGPCWGWMFNNSGDKLKLMSILQWGDGWRFAGVSTVNAYAGAWGHFYGCANLDILASDAPRMDAPVVNNESYLAYPFIGCTNLRSIGNPAAWKLAQVTDLWQAFYGCTNFDQDLGALNVSHLSGYMSSIFRFCTSFNNGGSPSIANWDVSKWKNCSSLFGGSCYAFNQELGAWNMSSLMNISFMFNNATSFNNGDPGNNQAKPSLDNWNLSSVYQAPGVFSGASKFNQKVSSWRLHTCIDVSSMFQNCPLFNNGGDPGIDGWTVGECFTFNNMFHGATVFNQPIGSWDVSKGTNFNDMFLVALAFNQDISGWNVENGVSFTGMFNGATSFKRNVGAWWLRRASVGLANMFASNDMNVGNSPVQKLASPQDYSNSAWTKTNATVTTNTTGSPDGTTTADKIKPSATNSTDHSVKQTVTVSDGVNYTVRVAVKAVELTYAQLICTGAIASDVYVDLSTGSVVSSNGTVGVTDLGNGWYVVSISGTTASTSLVVQIKAWNNSAGTSFAGNASDGIALWQASAFNVASSTDNYSAFLRDITGWTGSGDGAATRTGVMSAVVAVGGSGYTVGDVLNIVGGTLGVGTQPASVRVATVDGSGAVVTVTVKRGSGNYDTQPSNAAATTGGTGNGCTLTLTWGTKFAGLPASKSFHGGSAKYSMVDRLAINARKNLVLAVGSGGKGWTITDSGVI